MSDIVKDYALGGFIGLLLGDSIGSYLEFSTDEITSEQVSKALEMPGGGPWNLGAGQITDDGELALSLGYGLMNHDPKRGFPKEEVFKQYHEWFKSHPFDIGSTCRYAFSDDKIDEELQASQRSQSNGGLMRILPLAIWSRNLSYAEIIEYAKADAKLSHPNKVCQEVNAIYCIAITYLINNEGDTKGCIEILDNYILNYVKEKEVVEWYQSSKKGNIVSAVSCMGHLKYAFWMSMYHLHHQSTFIQAISETLAAGGDTDTNCAIVGGLVGAYTGYKSLPEEMVNKLMNFNPTKDGRKRPLKYKPNNCLEIVDKLI